MKIAIYSCNFGNYRNEFKNYQNVVFNDNIDYFLFTDKVLNDDEKIKLKKWKIINIEYSNHNEIMDKYRWTTKYVKFILPKELETYDIIMWIDSKLFNKKYKIYKMNMYAKINQILVTYPNGIIYNKKHPERTTVHEELNITMNLNLENINNAQKFSEKILNFRSNFNLVELGIFMYKNVPEVKEIFFELF